MIRINSNMQLGDVKDNLKNINWKSFLTGWLLVLARNLLTEMKQSNIVAPLRRLHEPLTASDGRSSST